MQRNHLAEAQRRYRSLLICAANLKEARREYARALADLHENTGLSYAQIGPLVGGITRSRVQQLVEEGRRVRAGNSTG